MKISRAPSLTRQKGVEPDGSAGNLVLRRRSAFPRRIVHASLYISYAVCAKTASDDY